MNPLRIPNPYTALVGLVTIVLILCVFVYMGYRWGRGNGFDAGYTSVRTELNTLIEDRNACVADRNDYSHAFAVCAESTNNLQRAVDALAAQHAINEANAEKLRGRVIAIDAEATRDRLALDARNRALVEACARDPECGEVLQ